MKVLIGYFLFGGGLAGLIYAQDSVWWIRILVYGCFFGGLDMIISGKIEEAKREIKEEIHDEIQDLI